jgi:hypothetical protein
VKPATKARTPPGSVTGLTLGLRAIWGSARKRTSIGSASSQIKTQNALSRPLCKKLHRACSPASASVPPDSSQSHAAHRRRIPGRPRAGAEAEGRRALPTIVHRPSSPTGKPASTRISSTRKDRLPDQPSTTREPAPFHGYPAHAGGPGPATRTAGSPANGLAELPTGEEQAPPHADPPRSAPKKRPAWNFRDRGFALALEKARLAGNGITIHGLRSAAISLYAARGLTMLETATVMGQADPGVTWKHFARVFDRSDVDARVRAAQASLDA